MQNINYQTNTQLWKMKAIAKEAGYKKISDAYWCQIFTNPETGHEFMTSREEESTNDPLNDIIALLTKKEDKACTIANEAMTKHNKYMNMAKECRSYEEANALIERLANDPAISARKYEDIRRIAIKASYDTQ